MIASCIQNTTASRQVASKLSRTLKLYYAYLSITSTSESEYFTTKSIEGFYGFILVEFDFGIHTVKEIFREARKLPTFIGLQEDATFYPSDDSHRKHVIEVYSSMPKTKLDYYAAWPLISKEGIKVYIDLFQFHTQYGATLTAKWYQEFHKHTRTLTTETMKTEIHRIQTILTVLYELYPDTAHLSYLQDGLEVNEAWEEAHTIAHADYVNKRADASPSKFKKKWQDLTVTLQKAFIRRGLISYPLYELFIGNSKNLLSKLGTGDSAKEELIPILSPLPLYISDSETASIVFNRITSDLQTFVECCESDRNKTMTGVQSRLNAAQIGNVTTDVACNDERYEDQCATWEHHNYNVNAGLIDFDSKHKYLYGTYYSITNKLMLLVSHQLLAFIYLLIVEHPFITPSWLLKFELYDKHGNESNFLNDGKVAISFKHRRGMADAQQECHLTERSKQLFRDIITITAKAREFLRLDGDDDYRYLLISCTGAGRPARTRIMPALCNNTTSTPLHKLLLERLDLAVVKAVTFKSVRATAAVKIYIDTGRIRAMSEALGHKKFNANLIQHYLPKQLLLYFYNRWTRIFQTAITYSAVRDRNCMAEVLGAQTMENIDEFFRNHGLKPLPKHLELGSHGFPNEISDETSRTHLIVPIDKSMCNVLVTMGQVIRQYESNGIKLCGEVEPWIQIIKFVETTVAMHCENQLRVCSNEAINIFKSAKFIPSLASKFNTLLAQAQ